VTVNNLHTVTGAFGYSGRYIAEILLTEGHPVRTITNSLARENRFGTAIEICPMDFKQPDRLTESLKGTRVLYNTYWVRFDHGRSFTHSQAVQNTLTLFECALKAGVERIVHVSITNPSADSDLPYFKGKAELEQALMGSGLSYSILRPAVLFGKEDILINNIAWFLRHFPLFGVFGDGSYRLQPIYVEDLARLAVDQGGSSGDTIIDAIGPETFTFRELVQIIGKSIGKERFIVSIPPTLGLLMAKAVGLVVSDVVLTGDEIRGLMEGRLFVDRPATGRTSLTDWLHENYHTIGKCYTSELRRRKDRLHSYASN
jgi:uncharacterized protein YbjT (DUF2867 family)